MTLSLYIARKFGWMFTRVFLGFLGIMMLLDILDEMRRFSGQGISFGQAAQLSAMNVPEGIYRIMPLIMILTAISVFIGLARSSELVVVRSVGRSGLRFLLTPFLSALVIGVLGVVVFNPIVAATMKRYDVLWSRLAHGAESVLSVSADGLWLRQGGPEGQTVIHAARANADGTELFGATFLSFDAKGLPQERIEADKASLGPGSWTLTSAKRWPLASPNPEAEARTEATATLPSELTRDAIRDSFGEPSAIPIYQLPDYIDGLERAVTAFEQQLDVERRAPADAQDDSAGKLALARAIAGPSSENELVRITSERAHRRYGERHVRARVAQVAEVQGRVTTVQTEVHGIATAVLEPARAHGWLPPSWLARIEALHAKRRAQIDALASRLAELQQGFASLPRQEEDPSAAVPVPISWQD